MAGVAVIGGGRVGRTLATALGRGGLDVTVGVRTPTGPGQVPVAEAIAGAEAIVLAVPGAAVEGFAREHAAALAGRVVIDASNDLSDGHGGPMHHLAAWARLAPGVPVFRAFNTIGVENVLEPVFDGVAADLLYCGPEADRPAVEELIRATGLRPIWVGGPEAADLLDGATRLWFTLARTRGRRLAFRVLQVQDGSG